MKPRTIRYYFAAAFRSLIRNRLMTVASIFTVASCILIVSVFYIVSANLDFLVRQLESTLGIVVFIDEHLPDDGIFRLETMIRNIPQVDGIDFISREEALQNMSDMFNPRLMAGFELRNPLRDSFAITLVDLAYQDDAIRLLEQLEPYGASNIRADERGAGILRQMTFVVQIVSGTLILMLGVVSTIIITNTIRITVNARRTEINIMKYVGATDWFIRWPFIIEGILIGIIGGIIPATACWFGYPYIVDLLQEFFGDMLLLPSESIFAYLFPFAMVMGTLIGIIGSGVSLRRHLNV